MGKTISVARNDRNIQVMGEVDQAIRAKVRECSLLDKAIQAAVRAAPSLGTQAATPHRAIAHRTKR